MADAGDVSVKVRVEFDLAGYADAMRDAADRLDPPSEEEVQLQALLNELRALTLDPADALARAIDLAKHNVSDEDLTRFLASFLGDDGSPCMNCRWLGHACLKHADHDHIPIQHRDGKPAWCNTCGLTDGYKIPTSKFERPKE